MIQYIMIHKHKQRYTYILVHPAIIIGRGFRAAAAAARAAAELASPSQPSRAASLEVSDRQRDGGATVVGPVPVIHELKGRWMSMQK
jgi:hypothetical protein